MLWKNLFMILNIDTKYYDTKYYSGLLYTRKQNFSKESIFSLLPPSRGRPAWSSIFSGGHRMPGHLPQSDKGNSAPPGSDHIWYSIYTHQALPLRTWIQCWERGPKGKAVGQMCSSQLQITPRRTSSFLCTWFSVAWKVKEVTKHTATKPGGKNSCNCVTSNSARPSLSEQLSKHRIKWWILHPKELAKALQCYK